jgi:hypothetical protein
MAKNILPNHCRKEGVQMTKVVTIIVLGAALVAAAIVGVSYIAGSTAYAGCGGSC